jgi:iron complex outermembrane receptor protein
LTRISQAHLPSGGGGLRLLCAAAGILFWAFSFSAAAAPAPDSNQLSSTSPPEYVTINGYPPEKAQNLPISLTAVSGYTLEENGVTSIAKLPQFVPTLQVYSFNPRNTDISIRGLGSNISITNDGIEPGVGIYVDGVLYARPAAAIFDLPDIASVEVLRGPQGTLYGKNSIAGAVNIETLMPSQTFEAVGRASAGNFGYTQLSGTVSGPLDSSGDLAARLSAVITNRGGFYTNVHDGEHPDDYHDDSLRMQILSKPSDDLTFRLIADYANFNSRRPVRTISGVVKVLANGQAVPRDFSQRATQIGYTPLPFDPYTRVTDSNAPIFSKMEQGGFSAQADWNVSGFTLTSISAFRFWRWRPSNDDDLTSLDVLRHFQQQSDEREVTQELRIASPVNETVEFNGGLYYFWEQNNGVGLGQLGSDAPIWILGSASAPSVAALNGYTLTAHLNPRINSYAGYGQATWHVVQNLDLIGGVRYTYEYKTGGYEQTTAGAPISGFPANVQAQILAARATFGTDLSYNVHTSNNLVGGLASAVYRFNDQLRTYATYSHGEKSAGLNLANLAPAVPKIVAPESINNYEAGLKSSLEDGRLRLNADVFWSDVSNYQATLWDTTYLVSYLANIPAVRSRGLEVDANGDLFDGLSVYLSAAYTDAIYGSYPNAPAPFEQYTVVATPSGPKLVTNLTADLSNRQLPAVSKWAFSVGGEYSQGLGPVGFGGAEVYLGFDESYRSSYFSNTSLSIYSRVAGYNLTNLRVGVRTKDGGWDLEAWVRNAFDRKYQIYQVPLIFNSGALSSLVGDPRTFGVTLTARL